MPERKPQPEIAFLAAALVLLVLPVLAMVGLTALGVALGQMSAMHRLVDAEAGWIFVTMSAAWLVLVVIAVLMLVARLTRRTKAP